jgi:hypothetical protein
MFWILDLVAVVVFLWVRSSRNGEREDTEDRHIGDRAVRSSTSKSTALPETDAWDLDAYEWDERIPVTAELSIHYRDINDQESHRDIATIDFAPVEGGVMVRAYCHSRRANRTLRASRMLTVIDRDSGEPVRNVVAYLTEKYNQSPEGKLRNAKMAFENELSVLVFVARADGKMLKKERVPIAEYLATATDGNVNIDFAQESLKAFEVNNSDFHRTTKELVNRSPEERQAIIDTAVRISELPKTPDPIAVGAVKKIEKKLKVAQ